MGLARLTVAKRNVSFIETNMTRSLAWLCFPDLSACLEPPISAAHK